MGDPLTDYISTSELADWMSIDDSDDDTLLEAACTAASRAVESWCNRVFTTDAAATARTYRVADPYLAHVDDFYTTSGLIVATDTGDTGTYSTTWTITTDYILEPSGALNNGQTWVYDRIAAVGSYYFPSGRRPRLQVTAKWGWAATPDAIVEACYIKAARLFRRKFSPEAGAGFDAGTGFSVPLIRVNVREDPDVVSLLAPYVRSERGFVAG